MWERSRRRANDRQAACNSALLKPLFSLTQTLSLYDMLRSTGSPPWLKAYNQIAVTGYHLSSTARPFMRS